MDKYDVEFWDALDELMSASEIVIEHPHIARTRALHRLNLFCGGEVSPLL